MIDLHLLEMLTAIQEHPDYSNEAQASEGAYRTYRDSCNHGNLCCQSAVKLAIKITASRSKKRGYFYITPKEHNRMSNVLD